MSGGAIAMTLVVVITLGVTAYLVGTLARSISNEKSTRMKLWKNFGLSLGFCALFFITWAGQGVAQWQRYTDEQREHKQPVEVGDFMSDFTASTLENWQSEFLQLFSFTIMAAVLIHKGSAESKDGTDRVEAALKRIEEKLDTEPTSQGNGGEKDLHVIPDEMQGWQLRSADSTEPEGYYDTQQEAVDGGRELARSKGVQLLIHGTDGDVRASESSSQ
jgi:Uncharacterized protein conserved in bacteria (DUF2188)